MIKESAAHGQVPDGCFVVITGLPPGRNVAIARRGRFGVHVTSIDFGGDTMARAAVRILNEANGVSAAVERAMLAGAILGWDCELADPACLTKADRRLNRTTATGFSGSARIH